MHIFVGLLGVLRIVIKVSSQHFSECPYMSCVVG
jgi:hypothetical protein